MKNGERAKKAVIAFVLLASAYVTGAWLLWGGIVKTASTPRTADATMKEAVILSDNPAEEQFYPVEILRPGIPRVFTGKYHRDGTPESVACGTCHATKQPNLATASGGELDEFHVGLKFAHGTLNCLSCHHADDYDSLRLADGSPVTFPNTMTLCAQCHGPQHRDYQHGSHGGMTGYWDRTKGPRQRNHCITCHDPHAPAYPQMLPVFKPKDTAGGGFHEKIPAGH